ncbi:MAG: hypothetical protein ACD_73C00756G0001, partial [uncultured bacterium]
HEKIPILHIAYCSAFAGELQSIRFHQKRDEFHYKSDFGTGGDGFKIIFQEEKEKKEG